jgi:alpha-mannosidase
MTAWVLGQETDDPTLLRSTGFSVLGAARNQGTNVPGGSSIAYRIDQTLEVPGTQSTVRLSTLLHGLEPRIDVTAEIDWREIGDTRRGISGLIVVFPTDVDESSLVARYEAPFGSVTRNTLKTGEEVPTLRYAHLAGTGATVSDAHSEMESVSYGFTLLQDCKYGHALDGSDLRLRIIRSSFDPDHAPEVNRQTVRYSLFVHEEEADPATLTRLGAAWNHPLIVFPADLRQGGDAPATRSFVRVRTPNVVLSTLKQAEDGAGLILRLVELNGQNAEAEVEIDPAITGGLTRTAVTDLMEQPLPDSAPAATFTNGVLRVPIRANSFVTVRLSAEP